MMTTDGIEDDDDLRAALKWLSQSSGDANDFDRRLEQAQTAYRTFTSAPTNRGKDPTFSDLGPDTVAAFFAQARSILEDRRTYDQAIGSQTVPWIKQLGRNLAALDRVKGADTRARRMLGNKSTSPESALYELVMASNYACEGFAVTFIEEIPGGHRTPDFSISLPDSTDAIYVECKRLETGLYEKNERTRLRALWRNAIDLIESRRLSIHIDVTFIQELDAVPDNYLPELISRIIDSPIVTPSGYPWKDSYGFGKVTAANLAAVREDIQESSLYFGTKLARLLTGDVVREGGYTLIADATPDTRDPRFIRSINSASVMTWQCIAKDAIEKKARYIKSKLAEVDRQLIDAGPGVTHIAMDFELHCESSDLRRARNNQAISEFQTTSGLLAIYLHYLVPRISERHAWLIDETVDRFGPELAEVQVKKIFRESAEIDNRHPAWWQRLSP